MCESIKCLPKENIHLTFQSRFGSDEWLGPDVKDKVFELISKSHKKIAVFCPGFLFDCLETTNEIGLRLKDEAKKRGCELQFISSLNDNENWCQDFSLDLKTIL
jgi:protoheme ferro-lyase